MTPLAGDGTAVLARHVGLSYRTRRYPAATAKDAAFQAVRGRRRFEAFVALRDVSLRVRQGEVLGVIGANGAGKSTLLRVLAGVLPPTTGRVVVSGSVAPMLDLGLGFEAEFTAAENVELYGALLGREPRALRQRAAAVIEWAGLTEFADVPLRAYSAGMLARLAFAISTDWAPDVLLIDEVLSVGDEAFQRRSRDRLRELISGGAAVVIVSHAAELIAEMADRVLWLDRGQAASYGHPSSVVAAYHRSVNQQDEHARVG